MSIVDAPPVIAKAHAVASPILPIPAFKYKGIMGDMVDLGMSWTLRKLDAKSTQALWLRRLAPGKYEIDRRRVTVDWLKDSKSVILAVQEDDVRTGERTPLLQYLQMAAGVAAAREAHATPTGGSFDMSKQQTGSLLECDAGSERVMSMLQACREAGVS